MAPTMVTLRQPYLKTDKGGRLARLVNFYDEQGFDVVVLYIFDRELCSKVLKEAFPGCHHFSSPVWSAELAGTLILDMHM